MVKTWVCISTLDLVVISSIRNLHRFTGKVRRFYFWPMKRQVTLFILCFVIYTAGGLKCFTCHEIADTRSCQVSLDCAYDEVCATRNIFTHNGTQAYRMGCEMKDVCEFYKVTRILGDSFQSHSYCRECCNHDNCNNNSCSWTLPTGSTATSIVTTAVSVGATFPVTTTAPMTATSAVTTTTTLTSTSTMTTTPGIPPHISNPNQTVSVSLHTNAVLTCNITGSPPPQITWIYDTLHGFNAKSAGGNLSITHVVKENEGTFTCLGNNSYGSVTGSIKFKVTVPVEVKLERPVVVIDPSDKNGIARLKCTATGDPAPTVAWMRFGSPSPMKQDSSHFVFPDGDLLLTGINSATIKNHTGIYICKGDNNVTSTEAYQIASEKIPDVLNNETTFKNISVEPGQAFTVSCPVDNDVPHGLPKEKEYKPEDKLCWSARLSGFLGMDAGNVTYYVTNNSTAVFVDELTGLTIS